MSQRYTDNPNTTNNRFNHATNRDFRQSRNQVPNRSNTNNPLGIWIQNRRSKRRNRPLNESSRRPVGTEAKALENIQRNSRVFNYPTEGFITPIEHSLLYAMILYPEQYPESVVRKEIEEEEFDLYLYVKDVKQTISKDAASENGKSAVTHEKFQNSTHEESNSETIYKSSDVPRVSYAQLSALLALSAENNSSQGNPKQTQHSDPTSSNRISRIDIQSNNSTNTLSADPPLSIGQTLCRKILRVVTQYSDSHSLDRQYEIRELLEPVERHCQMRNEKAALKQLLPAYAGYTLSLVTGNPLPLLIGAAALMRNDSMTDENANVSDFRGLGGRTADFETAGLLDECEDD